MVHYLRYHQLKKGGGEPMKDVELQNLELDCANSGYCKRTRPKLFTLLFLALLSCCFVFAPFFVSFSSSLSLLYSLSKDNDDGFMAGLCSSVPSGTICCDRSGYRSDICITKGDIRTRSSSSSIFLYNPRSSNGLIDNVSRIVENSTKEEAQEVVLHHEKIKPYTRKWETSVMDTIDELNIISKLKANFGSNNHDCDVHHNVPAVFFSTGGYTGNVYHEFNDGIIPLFITSQHFNKQVVFVILEYHKWWVMKYGDILSHLSDFPPIDFAGDNRTHCFSEAIVGLRIHDELTVDSSLTNGKKSIVDFRNLLDRAYWPRIKGLIEDEERELAQSPEKSIEKPSSKPKLAILSRTGARVVTNEKLLVKIAEELGFEVEVLRPDRTTELAKIYRALNASEVMIGVHGAAMTHFLFMRPKSVFIQVVPLGTSWAAETYYGEPARKLGLKYIGYEIQAKESSLYEKYDRDDPILTNPESINQKGWEYTKKIYLDSQNVTLDLRRFRKRLNRAYQYTVSGLNTRLQYASQ